MAIYRLHAGVFTRSAGQNVIASLAYRAGCKLTDERTGQSWDYSRRKGVAHAEIMAPDDAPPWVFDRAVLWNRVEAREDQSNHAAKAQLARNLELALPHEMTDAARLALVRGFIRAELTGRGMVVDFAIHAPHGTGDDRNWHAHLAVTLRRIKGEGFGNKDRAWNALFTDEKGFKAGAVISSEQFKGLRGRWAAHVNRALEQAGLEQRVDHRAYTARGIDREPEPKLGPFVLLMEGRGETTERGDAWRGVKARNAERAEAEAALTQARAVLAGLTRHHSTFTRHALAKAIHLETSDPAAFNAVMRSVETLPDLVRLGPDAEGRERFTTHDMRALESRMASDAAALAETRRHGVGDPRRVLQRGARSGLSDEQQTAVLHVTDAAGLVCLTGYAGAGKSRSLSVAREVWEAAGYRVQGLALSGIAAEGLEGGSGITSRTIASQLRRWESGRDGLTARDVLVLDEAGMVDSRTMEQLTAQVRAAGAKLVLVGDAQQLQAIGAGGAFRLLTARHGSATLKEIWRQKIGWQKDSTRDFAEGEIDRAFSRYEAAGCVHRHETDAAALDGMIAAWSADGAEHPESSRIMLAPQRVQVADLNSRARAALRQEEKLGPERVFQTAEGEQPFAVGDRLMFRRNERLLGVKNGTLGTVAGMTGAGLMVRLDSGRVVDVDTAVYPHVTHGYAATVHKAQGVTVDRVQVLAASNMDRHSVYVALTRQRDAVGFHWSGEAFRDRAALLRPLSRDGTKDTSLDYAPSSGGRVVDRCGRLDEIEAALRDARARLAALRRQVMPDRQDPPVPPWETARRGAEPNRYRGMVGARLSATRRLAARIMARVGWKREDAEMVDERKTSTPRLDALFGAAKGVTRQAGQVAGQVRDGIDNAAGSMARTVGGKMLDRMFGDTAPKLPLSAEQARVAQQRMKEENTEFQPKEELAKNREQNPGKWHHWQRGKGGMER